MRNDAATMDVRYLMDVLCEQEKPLFYPFRHTHRCTMMIALCITLAACRKHKDNTSPQIEILSPAIQSSYAYNDILLVSIQFSDDNILNQLQIELVSSYNNRVLYSSTYYLEVATYVFNESISLQDRYWPEGEIFLRATASDGINTSTQIRELYYGEAPLTIDNEWRIAEVSQGYSIFNLQDELILAETKEYVGGGYEPRSGKYWVAHGDGTLASRSIAEEYDVSTFSLGSKPLTSFYDRDLEQFFIGCENGSIWKWQNGNVQSFVVSDNQKVRQITANSTHLFVWKEESVTGQDHICIYNILSGTLVNSVISSFNIASIAHSTGEKILVAGNDNGTAQFRWLQSDSEALLAFFTFTEISAVKHVWQAMNGGVFALHDSGLFYYSADLASMQFVAGILPINIIIDYANQEYLLLNANGVYRLDTTLNNSVFIAQGNIIDYILLYNK